MRCRVRSIPARLSRPKSETRVSTCAISLQRDLVFGRDRLDGLGEGSVGGLGGQKLDHQIAAEAGLGRSPEVEHHFEKIVAVALALQTQPQSLGQDGEKLREVIGDARKGRRGEAESGRIVSVKFMGRPSSGRPVPLSIVTLLYRRDAWFR